MKWMNNSDGKPDAIFTFAAVAFVAVLLKFLASGMSVTIGSGTYSFGDADAGTIAALLTPTLGAYVGRRWTTRAYPDDPADPGAQDPDPDPKGREG